MLDVPDAKRLMFADPIMFAQLCDIAMARAEGDSQNAAKYLLRHHSNRLSSISLQGVTASPWIRIRLFGVSREHTQLFQRLRNELSFADAVEAASKQIMREGFARPLLDRIREAFWTSRWDKAVLEAHWRNRFYA